MKKQGIVSIAFLISVLAILALSWCTYNSLVLWRESASMAIIGAALVFAVGLVAMILAVVAKRARTHFGSWRIVKWISVAVMCAVCVAGFSMANTGLNYYINLQDLKRQANVDVEAADRLIQTFKSGEQDRLETTVTGLRNIIQFRPTSVSPSLNRYLDDVCRSVATGLNSSTLDAYYNASLLEINDTRLNVFSAEIDNIRQMVRRWSLWNCRRLPDAFASITDTISVNLSSMSRRYNFPVISADSRGAYNCAASSPYEYRLYIQGLSSGQNTASPSDTQLVEATLKFNDKYSSLNDYSAVSIALLALLCVLYFFDFLITYPSNRKPVSKGVKTSDSHGIAL